MKDTARTQSVRNAWTNALRAEVLRVHTLDMAKVAGVGSWIATYADADGGGAFPSRETLATLAGCSPEAVTRAVKVLVAVGMLARKRRPNAPTMYQLMMPLGRPDWAVHMHLYSDTRQRSWNAEKKRLAEKEAAARTASVDAVRTASALNVPDSVHGRGPNDPDSVHGRPRTASADGIRTASTDAPTNTDLPTVGTPFPDQDAADDQPQPQVAREQAAANDLDPCEGHARADPPPLTGLDAFRAARDKRAHRHDKPA